MRILLLNQAYAPDAAATAQHCEDLARHLVHRGHDVAVIASRSIYGQAGAKLPSRETRDGVEVHRVGYAFFGKRGLLLRSLDFALFYVAAAIRAMRIDRPDVVVTLTTPPFIGILGGGLKRLRRCGHVYWAMDLYPDVLVAAGVRQRDALLTRLLERINRRCMRRADRVVALGRCMRELILSKGIPEAGVRTIGVWPANDPPPPPQVPPQVPPETPQPSQAAAAQQAATPFDPSPSSYRETWDLHGRFIVQYAGNFGLAHDVETICRAMLRLRDRRDLCFVFVGGGKRIPVVEAFVAQHGLTNVLIKPYQPRDNLDALLRLADVHLISQAAAFTGIVVPSKVFGIMAAQRGALFIGPPLAEVARVLSETDAGRVIRLGDDAALAEAIDRLTRDPQQARDWGRRALHSVVHGHAARHRCAAWESLLEEVASNRRA